MPFELPPIVKLVERLLVDVEQAVQRFARRHRYVVGVDLRREAMRLAKLANRAWRDRAQQDRWIADLVWSVDDFKLTLQIAKRVEAFQGGFAQFEALARLTVEIGRQVGGWQKHRQQHPKGQNDAARAPGRRPQTLSTRAASAEANP